MTENIWTFCYESVWTWVLVGVLVLRLAWDIKSLRSHMKTHVLHWQWIVRSEVRKAPTKAEQAAAAVKGDTFYKVTALILAMLVIVGIVVYAVSRMN